MQSKILTFIVLAIFLLSCHSEKKEGSIANESTMKESSKTSELKKKARFTTSKSSLLDANGNEFVMKGVNVPFAWFAKESFESLNEIARQNVNCVRIVWTSKLPAEDLDSILQKCIDLKMVPMVELHDATGDTTETKLYKMAEYFVSTEMKSIIKKYDKYLLLNIANEWGSHEVTAEYWKKAYEKCISLFRNEGIESLIVIDAPGWGQNSDPILLYGQQLIDYDPLHNLLFSVHMYGSWNDESKIKADLQKSSELSLPLIIGEFGYNYNNGDNNLTCKVNHNQILKTCFELNIGYLAWSWTGNNAENKWLDLTEYSDWKTLTDWGSKVVLSEYGIKKTAKKTSIFE